MCGYSDANIKALDLCLEALLASTLRAFQFPTHLIHLPAHPLFGPLDINCICKKKPKNDELGFINTLLINLNDLKSSYTSTKDMHLQ